MNRIANSQFAWAIFTHAHVCILAWYCKTADENTNSTLAGHHMEVDLGEEAYVSDDRELEESRPGPSKRAKNGAGTYQTRFNADWTRTWPFIQEVRKVHIHVSFCALSVVDKSTVAIWVNVMSKDISRNRCTYQMLRLWSHSRHSHFNLYQVQSLAWYLIRPTFVELCFFAFYLCYDNIFKVMRAEVKVATMLVQNNVPLALADELTPLFRDIFSDSEIAKRYASRQTKTACIINGAVAPYFH